MPGWKQVIFILCLTSFLLHCTNSNPGSPPSSSISGTIFDELQLPISGARIVLIETIYNPNLTDNNDGFSKNKVVLGTTFSNQDGSFEIDFEPGNLGGLTEIIASKEDFERSTIPVTVKDQHSSNSIRIQLAANHSGNPPESAKIIVEED